MERGSSASMSVLVMRTGECSFGVAADAVDRVFAAAEIAPLPGAPEAVAGVVNIHGRIVPVLDLRRRLGPTRSQPSLSACLVLLANVERPLAVLTDSVEGVSEVSRSALAAMEGLVPGAGLVKWVAPGTDGLILIHDAAAFLSASEEACLTAAMAELAA